MIVPDQAEEDGAIKHDLPVGSFITGVDRSYQRSIYRVIGYRTVLIPGSEHIYGGANFDPTVWEKYYLMVLVSFDGWAFANEKEREILGNIEEYRLATEEELKEEQVRCLIKKGRDYSRPGGKAQELKG